MHGRCSDISPQAWSHDPLLSATRRSLRLDGPLGAGAAPHETPRHHRPARVGIPRTAGHRPAAIVPSCGIFPHRISPVCPVTPAACVDGPVACAVACAGCSTPGPGRAMAPSGLPLCCHSTICCMYPRAPSRSVVLCAAQVPLSAGARKPLAFGLAPAPAWPAPAALGAKPASVGLRFALAQLSSCRSPFASRMRTLTQTLNEIGGQVVPPVAHLTLSSRPACCVAQLEMASITEQPQPARHAGSRGPA